MAKKRSPQWQNPKRVLVIQSAFLGDIVLATSFLKNLRALLPDAEISFLSTPVGAELMQNNAWHVVPIAFDKRGKDRGPHGLLRKIRELRVKQFDIVFSLHRSLRSTLLAKGLGAKAIFGFREAAGSLLFSERVSRRQALFEAEKNILLLKRFCERTGRARPDFDLFPELNFSKEEKSEAQDLLQSLQKARFLAIAPSSVWATKRWPAERFGEVAQRFLRTHGLRTVILGSRDPADKQCAEILLEAFRKDLSAEELEKLPLDLTGKSSVGVLKAVLSEASFLIANDSAPMHMSIAMGTPVLGIFGSTTKELGFFPLAPNGMSAVMERQGLACRPCGKHGHKKCPKIHFRCMLEIEPEAVYEAAAKLMKTN